MFNNAGINNVLNEGLKNWQGMLAVNVGGVIQGTELARDSFRASGKGGVIINTASVAGLSAMPGSSVYGATKWAIVGFTRSLQNWRKQEPPIRVAAVCPTLVLTEGGLLSKQQDEKRLEKRRKEGKTVKPMADPVRTHTPLIIM